MSCFTVKRLLSKRTKNVFQDLLSLNAGQNVCRMLQGEHSAVLSTFIKLTIFHKDLSFFPIFEWPFYTGFTVYPYNVLLLAHLSHKILVSFCDNYKILVHGSHRN